MLSDVDSAYLVLPKESDCEKIRLQEETALRMAWVQKISSLSQALRGPLGGMSANGCIIENRQSAQSEILAAPSTAKASDVLLDAESLRGALSVLGRDSASQFPMQREYLREFYSTRRGIEDLPGLSDDAQPIEERSLRNLEDQVWQYSLMLKRERVQIDVHKGILAIGLPIEQAILTLRGAMQAASASPVVAACTAVSEAYKRHLGRAPDTASMGYWKDVATAGMPFAKIVSGIANLP